MTEEKKSLEARTDMTELEEILSPIVTREIDGRLASIRGSYYNAVLDSLVKEYITMLEKCEQETAPNKHGYDIHQYSTDFDRIIYAQNLLENLRAVGLVTDTEFHLQVVTDERLYRGRWNTQKPEFLGSEGGSVQTLACYTITQLGKEKLEEHRVAKNAHS